MSASHLYRAMLSALRMLFAVAASAAQTLEGVLNCIPFAAELDGRPPELFTYLTNDLFAVVDPLDNRIVVFEQGGRIAGASAALPRGFAQARIRLHI